MSQSFVAACVTMRSGREPAANRDDAARMIREAAAAGAAFVQTPEITNICDRNRAAILEKTTTEEKDETLAALREVARETGVTLQIGSLALRSKGERLANRGFMIGTARSWHPTTRSISSTSTCRTANPGVNRTATTAAPARSWSRPASRRSACRSATTSASRASTGRWRRPGPRS